MSNDENASISRRALLAGGIGLVGLGGFAAWRALGPPRFDLVPRPGAAGFLSLPSRGGGLGGGLFAGLSDSAPAFTGDLCAALFDPLEAGRARAAIFTDYRCPNCRAIADDVLALARRSDLSMRFHDWPILGESSIFAAKAANAASLQGRAAYLALHERLMKSGFAPTPAWLRSVASGLGLDAERLLRDAADPARAREIARTDALARRLALLGTPSLVFGDVIVEGAMSARRLDALARRAATNPPPCATS